MIIAQLTLTDPPPSVNSLYVSKRNGGKAKTRRYAAWRKAAEWELHLQWKPRAPIATNVAVMLLLPVKTQGDADNRLKAAQDALQVAMVVENDRLCRPTTADFADVPVTTIILSEPTQ